MSVRKAVNIAIADVFTDGCCHSNGQYGARAGVGVYFGPNDPRNISARLTGEIQTNQRAELTAAIRALEYGYTSCRSGMPYYMRINTDSEYTIKCLTEWGDKWVKNGWKTSSGQPVSNVDLIRLGRQLISDLNMLYSQDGSSYRFEFRHVRGHSGIRGNEEADTLANDGARLHSF